MVLRIKSLRELGKHVRVVGGMEKRKKGVRIPRAPSVPQKKLWQLVKTAYPDAEEDKSGLVPGRKYESDIFIDRLKLCIELDGWTSHGRYKEGFTRDRQKDRLLLLNGFRVVRFTAGEVLKNSSLVMETLNKVVEVIESERRENDGTTSNQ